MSQYINQMNCNIAEVARLQFNEVLNDKEEPIFSTIVCMHVDFLKEVHRVIGNSLAQYDEQLKNKESNKALS